MTSSIKTQHDNVRTTAEAAAFELLSQKQTRFGL